MTVSKFVCATAVAMALAAPVGAQQPTVRIDDDDITVQGCVSPNLQEQAPLELLLWSRSGILSAASAVSGDHAGIFSPQGLAGRVFYWMERDKLAQHVGQLVEIKGELEDPKTGEVEIDREGAVTEIKMELGGREESIRVPTALLHPATDKDDEIEFEIVARKIDIDDIRILGACPRP